MSTWASLSQAYVEAAIMARSMARVYRKEGRYADEQRKWCDVRLYLWRARDEREWPAYLKSRGCNDTAA